MVLFFCFEKCFDSYRWILFVSAVSVSGSMFTVCHVQIINVLCIMETCLKRVNSVCRLPFLQFLNSTVILEQL